ncbi:MAG TPA: hypothetical protein VNJ01_06480 [Bacteriovoracaceae bacterium]|nr:hypothetical protein [Bacteriovoracaceae bacterium]
MALFCSLGSFALRADEIRYAGKCVLKVTPKSGFTANPATKEFFTVWPWALNDGVAFKTEFAISPGNRRLKVEVLTGQLRASVTSPEQKINSGYGDVPAGKLSDAKDARSQSFGPFGSEIESIDYSCRQVPIKELIEVVDSQKINDLVTKMNCDNGIEIGKDESDNRVRGTSVSSAESSNFSDDEIQRMQQRGRFYDKTPGAEDETDKWINKLSPYVPLDAGQNISCDPVNANADLATQTKAISDFYQKLKSALVTSLGVPKTDAQRLYLIQDLDCAEADKVMDSNGGKELTPAMALAEQTAKAQCAYKFCQSMATTKEIRFPNRYFRRLMLDFRVDRWKEIVGDSVQPFFELNSNRDTYTDENFEVHFLKVPKGTRPDPKDLMTQIFADRLKLSADEAKKMTEKFLLTDAGKAQIASISQEIDQWQTTQKNREARGGLVQLTGGSEVIPVLNLRTDLPKDEITVEVTDKKPPQPVSKKTNPQSKPPQKNPPPSKVGPTQQSCTRGLSERCYTIQQLRSNPEYMEDVNLKNTFGNGRAVVFLQLPSDYNCDGFTLSPGSNGLDKVKSSIYEANKALFEPVKESLFSSNDWSPAWDFKEEESMACLEANKHRSDVRLLCANQYTCRTAKGGGAPFSIALGKLKGEQYKKDKTEQETFLREKVIFGDSKTGELEFIPFGSKLAEFKEMVLACDRDKRSPICQNIKLSKNELDLMLTQAHGFKTVDEFRSFMNSEQYKDTYKPWYDKFLAVTSDPNKFAAYVAKGFSDGGIYIMVPQGQEGNTLEGIETRENPFKTFSGNARTTQYFREAMADKKLRDQLFLTNPLLQGIQVLGLQNTYVGQTLERSNAEFYRGATEYLQSWTSKPLEAMYGVLSTNDTVRKVFECTNFAYMSDCLGVTDGKVKAVEATNLLNTFNSTVTSALERPESMYCPQTNTICLENWARMAPALLGDTAIMLLSAPIPGGIYASGMLLAARQASDSYYMTIQAKMPPGMTWKDLTEAQKKAIVNEAVKNGAQTFIVNAAATLAGMKLQQAVSGKVMAAGLETFNTRALGSSSKFIKVLADKQMSIRALGGEIVGGVPVNLGQASADLYLKCKQGLQSCDSATFTSALFTSMVMMAPTTLGPGIARIVKSTDRGIVADTGMKSVTDGFSQSLALTQQRQSALKKLQENYSSADLPKAEGSVKYVLVDGRPEPRVLLRVKAGSDEFGWYDLDSAVIKSSMNQSPKDFVNVKPPVPLKIVQSKADLLGDGTPKPAMNAFIEQQSKAAAQNKVVVEQSSTKPQATKTENAGITAIEIRIKELGGQFKKNPSPAKKQELRTEIAKLNKQVKDFEIQKRKEKTAPIQPVVKAKPQDQSQKVPLAEYEGDRGPVVPKNVKGTWTGKASELENKKPITDKNRFKIEGNMRDLEAENASRETLLAAGFDVEQNPIIPELKKDPDYKINGSVFDHYAPNMRDIDGATPELKLLAIYTKVMGKVTDDQAHRIVLRLDKNTSDTDIQLLKKHFDGLNNPKIQELIIIRENKVEHWHFGAQKSPSNTSRVITVSDVRNFKMVPRKTPVVKDQSDLALPVVDNSLRLSDGDEASTGAVKSPAEKRYEELEKGLKEKGLTVETSQFPIGDETKGFVQIENSEGVVGTGSFTLKDGKTELVIDSLLVDPNFRGQNFSDVLIARVLKDNPSIVRTSTALADTNAKAYIDAIKRGPFVTREQAIRETPAFKIREKLGFTEIDMNSFKVVVKSVPLPERLEINISINRPGASKLGSAVTRKSSPLNEIPAKFRNQKGSEGMLTEQPVSKMVPRKTPVVKGQSDLALPVVDDSLMTTQRAKSLESSSDAKVRAAFEKYKKSKEKGKACSL